MASSNNAPPGSNHVAVDMPTSDPCKELDTIFKAQPGKGGTSSSGAEARPLIQKVPGILRENDEKSKSNYDPKLVSIGPYHYGDPKLKLGQTLKIRLVQQFASYVDDQINKQPAAAGRKSKSRLEAYFKSEDFNKVAREARNCYEKDSTVMNEEAFKCLMFLDGCFVVYFIHCIMNENMNKDMQMKNDHRSIIVMDLFLLENQLPYTLLQALVTDLTPSKAADNDINEFINLQSRAKGSPGRGSPLFKMVLDCLCKKKDQPATTNTTDKSEDGDRRSSSSKREPYHLLDFLRTKFLGTSESSSSLSNNIINTGGDSEGRNHSSSDDWQWFRSVDELKTAGITCVTSGSSCVKNINFFHPYRFDMYARLSLPAIIIDDSFKTKWLNLAAYEACPDFLNEGEITSFICFMDSLIDRPEDVKELRQQGILQNFLGSDERVAELFNELADDLTPNPDQYRQIKQNIQNHLNKKRAVWFAEAMHTHFSSPWTAVAFTAALFVLTLTCVQTYFAVFPRN